MQPNHPHSPYAQPAPNPYANPYAPPPPGGPPLYRQNVFVPYGATAGPLLGSALRNVKLGLGVVQTLALFGSLAFVVGSVAMEGDAHDVLFAVAMGGFAFWYLSLIGYGIVNVIWLYKFWTWIPPEQRHTNLWKKYISPGVVAGFMFIPYFNIYWMFVVYLGIADIMERMRVQYPSTKPPVKTLAILTVAVPMLFFPAAPFFQYFFAKRVEEMAREMHARMGGHVPA